MNSPLSERGVIHAAQQRAGTGTGVRVGIGDDCAVLDADAGDPLLATTDLLIEDVHFRRRYAAPADIGWKAIAVNLSDIASMGGRPRWALVALACPVGTPAADIEAFYDGVHALAAEQGVAVVGGDTSSSPHGWTINITLLGQVRQPRLRSTARAGDLVLVTGSLGRSAAGLAILERGAPAGVPAAVVTEATAAHLRPVPRVREGRWLGEADGVTSMMDVSDGLATDLGHIAEASGVAARVDVSRIPVSEVVHRTAAALGADPLAWVTAGGEDYELLLTCTPDSAGLLRDGLARATGCALTVIGEISAGSGLRFLDATGHDTAVGSGFQHFATGRPA